MFPTGVRWTAQYLAKLYDVPYVFVHLQLRQWIALSVVAQGWLFLDIECFALFLNILIICKNGEWEGEPVNHTSWVAVVTPTDRPKSVRNRCLIELFVTLFLLSLCPFDISVGVGAFVIGLGQISSFLSLS